MRQLRLLTMILLLSLTINASEEVPTKEEVAKLYVATFNRAPDSAGLTWWTNSSGLPLSGIAQSFFDQDETKALYPDGTSNADFITSVYRNLFNRVSDTDGLNYWEEELNRGAFSKNSFIQAVINGAKNTETSNDADILSNKTTVGLSFSEAGKTNVNDAKSIMTSVTADNASVTSAITQFGISKYEVTSTTTQEEQTSNTLSFTAEMLHGKTLYINEITREKTLQIQMDYTVSGNTVSLAFKSYTNGALTETSTETYTLGSDGVLTDSKGNKLTLTKNENDILYVLASSDNATEIWFIKKPNDFPSNTTSPEGSYSGIYSATDTNYENCERSGSLNFTISASHVVNGVAYGEATYEIQGNLTSNNIFSGTATGRVSNANWIGQVVGNNFTGTYVDNGWSCVGTFTTTK